MNPEDEMKTISIDASSGGWDYPRDYLTSDGDTIDLSNISDMDTISISGSNSMSGAYGNAGHVTINTTGTGGGAGGVFTVSGIGGGAGTVWTTNGTGGFGWQSPPANIQVGQEFSIVNPSDGSAPFIQYKDKKLYIDQLFSMVGAFKTMLSAVAKDEEFCKKHPEIRDLAYAYMLEELGK